MQRGSAQALPCRIARYRVWRGCTGRRGQRVGRGRAVHSLGRRDQRHRVLAAEAHARRIDRDQLLDAGGPAAVRDDDAAADQQRRELRHHIARAGIDFRGSVHLSRPGTQFLRAAHQRPELRRNRDHYRSRDYDARWSDVDRWDRHAGGRVGSDQLRLLRELDLHGNPEGHPATVRSVR
jgi:hypothetical protein